MQRQSSCTLFEWLDKWIVTFKDSKVKFRTRCIYRESLTLIRKNTSDIPLEDIIEMDLQILLNRLWEKEHSKSTIAKVYSLLKQALHKASRLHYISEDPTLEVELPNASTKKVLPLTHSKCL